MEKIAVGTMVLYKNSPAIVTGLGEKFEIAFLTGQGKKRSAATQNVRRKDFSPIAPTNLRPADLMQCEAAAANFCIDDEKIEELRSALEGEKNAFADIASLALDDDDGIAIWSFFEFLRKSPHFKIAADENGVIFEARTADELAAEKKKSFEAENAAKIYEDFLSRLKSRTLRLPDDEKYMQDVEALALGKTERSKTLKDARIAENPESAHAVLLQCGIWDETVNPHPARHGCIAKSDELALPHPPDEERLEFDAPAFAIDNAWSNDPDDAISFDGKYLWVHVADPASVVADGSKFDKIAMGRGSTLYVPEGPFWMVSPQSFDDFALGLKNPSNALSFKILLNAAGDIAETEIFRTRLNVTRKTYGEVETEKDGCEFRPFFEIARKNIARRRKNGAVFIEMPESRLYFEYGDGKRKICFEPETHIEAQDMVREMMLLAGEAAAFFAFRHRIPFAFVAQNSPNPPDEIPDGIAGQFALRCTMKSKSVSTTPAAHCGLGISLYSQVTSPLRRYIDLACHQQLRLFLDGKPLLEKDGFLGKILAANMAAVECVKAERQSRVHYVLAFLLQNPDWTGEALMLEKRDPRKNRVRVEILQFAYETEIVPTTPFSPNAKIMLRAGKIDLANQKADFIEI